MTATPSGTFVKTDNDGLAFIANFLPIENLDLSVLLNEITETSLAIGELKGAGMNLANPFLLIRPMQRNEAISSSNMEGTYSTLSELYLFEENEAVANNTDTKEVYNYTDALISSLKAIRKDKRNISTSFIKEIHATLLKNITERHRGSHITPGNYKKTQNWIGGGNNIKNARFIPATPTKTIELMDNLIDYINADNGIPAIVKIAIIHYQFEAIHPFEDGNGRVGRILIPIYLSKENILPSPLLYLSPFFEDNKDEYINLMYNVSHKGEWMPWISFFLKAIRTQAYDTINKIKEIEKLREEYKTQLNSEKASGSLLTICETLFERPIITIPRVQKILSMTHRGASLNIEQLVKYGILEELSTNTRPRYYVAQKIMQLYQKKQS